MKRHIAILFTAALACMSALAQTVEVNPGAWDIYLGTSKIVDNIATREACHATAAALPLPPSAARQRYGCRAIDEVIVTPCAALPAPLTRNQACPAGSVSGSTYLQTATYSNTPACGTLGAYLPASPPTGACPAAPVPTPTPGGATLHFSDCQPGAAAGCVAGVNSNPGTQASPKRNLDNVDVNALPAGSQLLFKRGGAWANFGQMLENRNATAAAPLVFDAYGAGPAPVLSVPAGNMFNIGGGWGNTTNDGGYVIRNLKLDGMGTAEWGLWFIQNVRDVTLENTEVTGFRIAINSNDGAPHGVSGITLRNNNIHHNRAMGLLGHYNDMLIEGNLFEANNFSGSTFDHGTYIGGGHNITLRNNRYLRNSTVNGVCQGGNMTFHGQIDGLLIEGNTVEQDAAANGCWLMSITQGYSSAEWFRNAVVRGNKLINGGNTVLAAQSAPGILVEGNVVINSQATTQTAFAVGSGPGPYADGDSPDSGAIVRDNVVCRANAAAAGSVVNLNSPGGSATGNVVRTGAEATTGACAR